MRYLAIEASTLTPSCALWEDGVITEHVCPSDKNSSETLLPAIQALLADHQYAFSQLDGIAFGAGPGAFTGLRVAAAITQGLAFPWDLPVAPIETLAAVAWSAGADQVYSVLDARMGEIYAGAYRRRDGRLIRSGDLQVAPPALLNLPTDSEVWTLCGNALAAYPALVERWDGRPLADSTAPTIPMAAAIAELGSHAFADGKGLPAEGAQPIYVRDKVALTTAERLARGGKA